MRVSWLTGSPAKFGLLGPGRRRSAAVPWAVVWGNVMDVIDRVQLTGLGMFGTFTGYRMKPGVSAFHDTHMRVCGTLAVLLRRPWLVMVNCGE